MTRISVNKNNHCNQMAEQCIMQFVKISLTLNMIFDRKSAISKHVGIGFKHIFILAVSLKLS